MTTLRPYIPIGRRDLAGNDRGRPRTGIETVTEVIAPLTLMVQMFAGPYLDIVHLGAVGESLPWDLVSCASLFLTSIAALQGLQRTIVRRRERTHIRQWRDGYIAQRIRERQYAIR